MLYSTTTGFCRKWIKGEPCPVFVRYDDRRGSWSKQRYYWDEFVIPEDPLEFELWLKTKLFDVMNGLTYYGFPDYEFVWKIVGVGYNYPTKVIRGVECGSSKYYLLERRLKENDDG